MPSYDKLNPQVQIDMDPNSATYGQELINPNTNNALSRTQVSTTPGEVLLQAMHLFLNQTNVIDWGKVSYGPGENGGITGIVFYDTTRAENDPRYNAGEPWQPGIPRVQVNLYRDTTPLDGIIDDLNGDGPTLADVDNYPFGWREDPNLLEPGIDLDRNGNGTFDAGDALQIVTSDSWDDNKPTGSIRTGPDHPRPRGPPGLRRLRHLEPDPARRLRRRLLHPVALPRRHRLRQRRSRRSPHGHLHR